MIIHVNISDFQSTVNRGLLIEKTGIIKTKKEKENRNYGISNRISIYITKRLYRYGWKYLLGVMSLANAEDEILSLKDPRVRRNLEYLLIILLSRVIAKLGNPQTVDTEVIENLYTMCS